jgi:hypothetical protein
MARAAITQAGANFLSDVDLKPGRAQSSGGQNSSGSQQIRFVDWGCQIHSGCNVQVKTRSLVGGSGAF